MEIKNTESKYKIFIFSIIIFFTFTSLFFIDNHSLISHDELLYANRAKLIIDLNEWFTPFESPHQKLVGSYWPTAISFKLFGFNEISARLPSYIFSLLSLYVLYKINKRIINKSFAITSILVLSSSFLWFNFSHYCSPDTLFIFLNLLGVFFLLEVNQRQDKKKDLKINLFLSSFFFAIAFFVRSYMEIMPLISFSPFIFYRLRKLELRYFIFILFGIFIGFIPSLLNLVFVFNKFGIAGIDRLFALFSQKVFEEENIFQGFIFYPRNIIIFNIPLIIFCLSGFIKTLKSSDIEQNLLFIFCPSISIFLLMITASTYSHYLLFTTPWIASLIAIGIERGLSFNNFFNKSSIRLFALILLSIGLLLKIFTILGLFFEIRLIDLEIINYIVILSISLVYMYFALKIFAQNSYKQIKNYILNFILMQVFLFSYLFGSGIIGNPNNDFKKYVLNNNKLNQEIFILKDNLEGKKNEVLSFYSKKGKKILFDEIPNINSSFYLYLEESELKEIKKIEKFDYTFNNSFKDLFLIKLEIKK